MMPEILEKEVIEEARSFHGVAFDVNKIREDFPILNQSVRGNPLVYLDNAATTQKPLTVIETVKDYYVRINANIHRGVHYLSETATQKYEQTRAKVQNFINAQSSREVIFTRGTTEAINLVASAFGRMNVGEGDEIIISTMEHHSNIVPWQLLCESTGAKLKIIPINDDGEIIFDEYKKLFTDRTKLVSIVHYSNSLGTINPVKQMVDYAHAQGAPVLIDGAQALSHTRVDVQDLDCDFYAFSSHKLFGPTGVGVLYGKEELLEKMPPYQGGGDMIKSVTFEKTTYNDLPNKFEAGTPNIAGVVGLGKAIDYVLEVGYDNITTYEKELFEYAHSALASIRYLRMIGNAEKKSVVFSFVLDGAHPHDVGTILDRKGIAIRTGHHCTQPVMDRFGIPATSRASFVFYNTKEEVDKLVEGIDYVNSIFH